MSEDVLSIPGPMTNADAATGSPIVVGSPADQFFTLIFAGNLRKFETNPHRVDTPFGKPVASGMGDAFAEIDDLRSQLEAREAEDEPLAEYKAMNARLAADLKAALNASRSLVEALEQAAVENDEAANVFAGQGLPGLASVYRTAAAVHRAAIARARGQ